MSLETLDGSDESLAQLFKPEMANILHEGVSVGLILQVSSAAPAEGPSRSGEELFGRVGHTRYRRHANGHL